MDILQAEFIKSSTGFSQCPPPVIPEFAFIGRSNVGKSSLLNMLCNRKNLAKTSATPGKTQLINHFNINSEIYFADLPGYGFAKISKEKRQAFDKMIREYIYNRKNLLLVFVLIDIRIAPQKIDLEFISWMGKKQIPFSIIFTKAEGLSQSKLAQQKKIFESVLLQSWEILPEIFISSAVKKTGREELLNYIGNVAAGYSL